MNMSEFIPTDIQSFRNFLVEESVETRDQMIMSDHLKDTEISVTEFQNALHFMQDIELVHALSTDEFFAGPPEDDPTDETQETLCQVAEAINFTNQQLRIANLAVVKTLSQLEATHNQTNGVRPYAADEFWDGELKLREFEAYFLPNIPDELPRDFETQ